MTYITVVWVRLYWDRCLHFSLKMADLNSNQEKHCACTLFRPTLCTPLLLKLCMWQQPFINKSNLFSQDQLPYVKSKYRRSESY